MNGEMERILEDLGEEIEYDQIYCLKKCQYNYLDDQKKFSISVCGFGDLNFSEKLRAKCSSVEVMLS